MYQRTTTLSAAIRHFGVVPLRSGAGDLDFLLDFRLDFEFSEENYNIQKICSVPVSSEYKNLFFKKVIKICWKLRSESDLNVFSFLRQVRMSSILGHF